MRELNHFIINNTKNVKVTLVTQLIVNAASLFILVLGIFYLQPDSYLNIQLTLSYVVFSGFTHLGLVDGIELRIAGHFVRKNHNGTYSILILLLSLLPSLIYLIFFFNSINSLILTALLVYPIINLNTFFVVLLGSYGFSFISSYGVILEKFLIISYISYAAIYAPEYINLFIFLSIGPFLFYLFKLKKVGIFFDFGFDFYRIILDLKRGATLMISNTLYNLLIFGSLILTSKLYNHFDVTRFSISTSFINLFSGISSQLSKVFFPLMSNKQKNGHDTNYKHYIKLIEIFVPIIILLLLFLLFLFNHFFKDLYIKQDVLKYTFIMVPIAYFESKNQIINLNLLKLRLNLKILLKINAISVFVGLLLFSYLFYNNNYDFIKFIYLIVFVFQIRYLYLSIYCKTITYFDFVFIFIFYTYLYFLV